VCQEVFVPEIGLARPEVPEGIRKFAGRQAGFLRVCLKTANQLVESGEQVTARAKYRDLSTPPRKKRVAPVEMTFVGVINRF
jgi:hypothetical protein